MSNKGSSKISTLDPAKLKQSDHIDISNVTARNITLSSLGSSPARFHLRYSHTEGARQNIPFPPNTKGFFVYHSPYADASPESGQIVFRLVPTPDPSLVHTAPMYYIPTTCRPWSIPLLDIAKYKIYEHVGKQLIFDGLVAPSVMDNLQRLLVPFNKPRKQRQVIGCLEQPWVFDFSKGSHSLFVLGHGRISTSTVRFVSLHDVVKDESTVGSWERMLTGKLLLTFEEYRRRLYLRIVEVLQPVRPVGSNDIIDSYAAGAFMPYSLSQPLRNKIFFHPKLVHAAKSPEVRPYHPNDAAWSVDPFDAALRDVELTKGFRLLMDDPLTEREKLVFDLSLEERARLAMSERVPTKLQPQAQQPVKEIQTYEDMSILTDMLFGSR